jgi:hypothetical protein
MKKLNQNVLNEIKNWIYRNARPLDLALWKYHFENGSREDILSILSHYQNSDGGFGNTIDPDSWNPNSTPYNAQIVIRMLRQINFIDITHPIYQGIFCYLENTEHKADYGWFFTIPSNNDYPHGVWWDYNPQDNTFQSIGITASLSGFILQYGDKKSNIYQMAINYTEMLIEKLKSTTQYGDMGVYGYCELLESVEGAGLMNDFDYICFHDKVQCIVRDKICNEATNFMANPLEFVLSPNSKFYKENKEEVEAALDRIVIQRHEMGVWDIPWEWYNGNKYPKAFAISENWWKSYKAIEKLLQLKSFNRLNS